MNKILTVLISITLALVLVLVGANLLGGNDSTIVSPSGQSVAQDVVMVYGQGKVSLKPDVAYITLGYENMDKDPKVAQSENTAMMAEIKDALKDAGLKEDDMQTQQYNVYQQYDYSGSERKIMGYNVTNTIRIKIEDIDRAGDFIKVAFDAGSNVFQGINFDVIDRQTAYLDAMEIALERAKEKAEALASETGRKIVDVVEVREGSMSTYTTYNNFAYDEEAVSMDSDGYGSVSAGELEISAVVNVVYQLD